LGDFLRKKRLDSNLTQKHVAENILKTSVDNIRNWEANRSQISLNFRPKVFKFLGFYPCDVSLPVGQRLKERRENFGLSIKKLSVILKVDACTIAYWERGEHQPSPKSEAVINGFLKTYRLENSLPNKPESFSRKDFPNRISIIKFVEYDSRWTIGQKIIAWRTSAGLSQRTLAAMSGVCFQSICRWEKGQRLPKPKYQKLLMHTICSHLDLFFQDI